MQFGARDLALMCSFAALYAAFSLVSLFPVIGAVRGFIALSSIVAPLIGLMLGPYVGAIAVSIGGFIGWFITQLGAFSFLSFVPGTAAAFSSGLLYKRKLLPAVILYLVVFLMLALYPTIGAAWLYPYYLWFQLIGLIVLLSPLVPKALNFTHENADIFKLSFGVWIISMVSTLFGQMTGGLMFEMMYWPTIHPQTESWRASWQFLTFVYPFERTIITSIATVVGAPLIKALRAYGFQIGGTKTNATFGTTYQTD